ncbi:hypothetical protein [Gordonia polyisoprenivorans]|uniref:hypothetical protein n=1 Tax=Gordonia polyisoprenivorans TaxID=84595 RepID=UPI001FCB2028|nr:hypothetical protein [Gordonia polyisoprenivorans]
MSTRWCKSVLPGDLPVVVGVDVHEARRDDASGSVDLLGGGTCHVSDSDDDAVLHGDIRGAGYTAGAVHARPPRITGS